MTKVKPPIVRVARQLGRRDGRATVGIPVAWSDSDGRASARRSRATSSDTIARRACANIRTSRSCESLQSRSTWIPPAASWIKTDAEMESDAVDPRGDVDRASLHVQARPTTRFHRPIGQRGASTTNGGAGSRRTDDRATAREHFRGHESSGFSPDESARRNQPGHPEPLLKGTELLLNRLKKRDWLLAVYRKMQPPASQSAEIERRHQAVARRVPPRVLLRPIDPSSSPA